MMTEPITQITAAGAVKKPANPFAGIEHLFAGDIEPVRHSWTYLGVANFVELRPMDSSAENRFRGHALTSMLRLQKLVEDGQSDALRTEIDDLQLELLQATVPNFQFARKLKDAAGASRVELTPEGKDLSPEARREIFEGLTSEGRAALVKAACEVAGMDPLLLDLGGILGSRSASPSSPENTETSGGDAPAE
jgi:hypothetical protein